MKFNIGDKFYTFEESTYFNSFIVKRYTVTDILIKGNNVNMFKDCDTKWFTEKECLTKEEVVEKINKKVKLL